MSDKIASKEEGAPEEELDSFDQFESRLRSFYELAGVPIFSDDSLKVGTLFTGLPPDEMAYQIAGHLRGRDLLFLLENQIGTIDPVSGEFHDMTASRFQTWLPSVAGLIPFKKLNTDKTKPVKDKVSLDDAKAVLCSDIVLNTLPVIKRINTTRLPVLRESGKIELLSPGYDGETGTYTIDGLEYPLDLDPNDAHSFLCRLFQYFGIDERSRAVQIASMLSIYGAGLFRGRAPLFIWNSNLPGSGKSRLAQLAIQVVHPDAGASGYHLNDPNETRKEMDATAQAASPVLWFDDVNLPAGREIRSSDLNRWLTVKVWEGRVMGINSRKFKTELKAATIMTGTHLKLNDHIGRRSLFVDMFARQRAADRKLPKDAIVLNDAFFEDDSKRAEVLASLWSLVRAWEGAGRPVKAARSIPSFEGWSAVIPSIVEFLSLGNCLEKFEAPDAGEVTSREIQDLVGALVEERNQIDRVESFLVTMRDIVATCRFQGLFQDTLHSLDSVVDLLEGKHGHEWKNEERLMTETPDKIRKLFARKNSGGFLSAEEDDSITEYLLEGDPTEESKRRQAAPWTDKSIDSKFGKLFREAAVTGQWFEIDGQLWQFGDRTNYRGTRFEVFRVEEESGAAG